MHYEPSHLRFDSLLLGVFLSYLHNFHGHVLSKIMSPPWRFPVSFLGILTALASRFSVVNQYALHAVYLAASIAAGIGASKLVEIPVLKMSELSFPSRAYGIAAPSAGE